MCVVLQDAACLSCRDQQRALEQQHADLSAAVEATKSLALEADAEKTRKERALKHLEDQVCLAGSLHL